MFPDGGFRYFRPHLLDERAGVLYHIRENILMLVVTVMLKRHSFFYRLLRPLVVLFLWLKFGYRAQRARNLPSNYIVLANHTTDWDPLFVGAAFRRMMYFVGSEHIARWPRAYKFLRFCFNPIMRYKGTTAFSTVTEMLRRLRAGKNVCLFAEGVRSWDGVNSPILPSTGKMVKKARCGLVTYRIEGGYFVSPMWSRSLRKGPIRGRVANVYTAEELETMTPDQINAAIVRDLHEDAYERQKAAPAPYRGKGLAEGLEELLFVCPQCGSIDTMGSRDDTVKCSACGHDFRYTQYGMLEGTSFDTVKELAAWQRRETARHADEGMTYTAPCGCLSKLESHKAIPLCEGAVSMDGGELACGGLRIPMDRIGDLAMHGKRTLVFSALDTYYELTVGGGYNALKFMLLYQAYKKMGAATAPAMR